VLDEAIKEIQHDALAPRESQKLPVFRADAFAMSPLRSRGELAVGSPVRVEKQELAKHKTAG
jgi:hypothetical protein